MSDARSERLAALARLREAVRGAADAFTAAHQAEIDGYRAEISAGVRETLDGLGQDVEDLTAGNPVGRALVEQAADYVDWLQWTLWDLPYLAAVLRPDRARFRRLVAGCALVYLSFRVIDDLLDRHYLYRAKRETLLATFTRSHGKGHDSEGLTVLAALLLCFEGLDRLAAPEEGEPAEAVAPAALRRVVGAARRTLIGAILERSDEQEWSPEFYERLVQLKNVDYWRILDAALDPGEASPLHPFLVEYYTLAQRLNDVQDHTVDEARGQPNLVTILRPPRDGEPACRGLDEPPEPTIEAVEEVVARDFLSLGARFEALPEPERGVAALKLGESLDEALRLGLFAAGPGHERPAAPAHDGERLRLVWDSTAEEFLERFGPDALEDVACAVCGGRQRRLLFRKQGFAYRRCLDCTHVFVSPRARADLRARIGAELDGLCDDPFLDVQRIQAEYLCRVFRRYARGPRLLDVGFGRGYLLHLAQAYGFEAYGVDSSATLLERLQPVFGRRLQQAAAGAGALPWRSFDVVVLSHVLEHLEQPRELLERAREALNSDGLLYVAVPDVESVQYRIFGKRWNVVSPVVHLQYFTEASLERLLDASGFDVLSRLEHPPEPPVFATRATRLFRALGGSETGELAMLCRPGTRASPADSPPPPTDGT